MQNDTYEYYLAFNEEPFFTITIPSEGSSDRLATVETASVERSSGSTDSDENAMRFSPTGGFEEHLAHGIGAGCCVRANVTDAMMDDLDETMNERTLPFEDPAPHEHVRQIRRWLDQIESELPSVDLHNRDASYNDDDDAVTSTLAHINAFSPVRRNRTLLLLLTLVVGSTMFSMASSIEISGLVVHVTFLLLVVITILVIV